VFNLNKKPASLPEGLRLAKKQKSLAKMVKVFLTCHGVVLMKTVSPADMRNLTIAKD
jgi:hypothetical protein